LNNRWISEKATFDFKDMLSQYVPPKEAQQKIRFVDIPFTSSNI